jgi:hypothetical protein
MTEQIFDNTESSETVIADSKLRIRSSKLALLGKIALKIIIGVVGLMIGSVLGFILAFAFGFIDFAC